MLTKDHRLMNTEERRTLETCARRALRIRVLVDSIAGGLGCWFLLLVPSLLIGLFMSFFAGPLAFLVGLLVAFPLGIAIAWQGIQEWRRLQRDLAVGEVWVYRVTADNAVKIKVGCCGGPDFDVVNPNDYEGDKENVVLDIGESKVLFLQGETVEHAMRSGQFPNRNFEVIRAPTSGVILRIQCHGNPLDFSTCHVWDYTDCPEGTMVVFSGLLDQLQRGFKGFKEHPEIWGLIA